MALVLDTSVLIAAIDPDDNHHRDCAALLQDSEEQLLVPVPVLTELEHLISRRGKHDAWQRFVRDLEAGAFRLFGTTADLVIRAAALQARYADLRIGFVDAAVFETCIELGERKVATLDRRHFSVLRTDDGQTLEILPP